LSLFPDASTIHTWYVKKKKFSRTLPAGIIVVYFASLNSSPRFFQHFACDYYALIPFEEVKSLWAFEESNRRAAQKHIQNNVASGIPRSQRQRKARAQRKAAQQRQTK
jgi:hypothetical protein